MSNLGFFDLRLVSPYEASWREAKSAVGAGKVMDGTRLYDSVGEAVSDCSLVVGTASLGHRELQHTVRRLEAGARVVKKHGGRVALLFGSEKHGLSNDDLSRCHWLLRIPTRAGHESMNLGQAVAVCLYELIRDSRAIAGEPRAPRAASTADMALLEEALARLLADSGYSQPVTAGSSRRKLRRLLLRMNLSHRDTQVWLGIFRQMQWRIDS